MKIEQKSVICSIVEAMLPVCTENKLLFISTRNSYSYYDDDIDCSIPTFTCNFIFYRPGNYTKVLFTKLEKIFVQPFELEKMLHTSDHDSCWRNDGVEYILNGVHHDACDKLKKKIINKKGMEFADSVHRFIYTSSPSYSSLERIEIIDGIVKNNNRDDVKYLLSYDKDKKFFTFMNKKRQPNE